MSVLRVKLLKLTILNLLFLNLLAQEAPKLQTNFANSSHLGILSSPQGVSKDSSLTITPITTLEIQAQSVLLASNINRDWWIRAGVYSTAIVAAGCLIYNRAAIREYWQGDKKLIVDPGFTAEERQKVRELLVQTESAKQQVASNSFWSQVKNGTVGAAGMAVVGVVAEPVLTPMANKTFKFMRSRNLDYYLHKTQLLEQIEHLRLFILTMGDATPSAIEIPGLLVHELAVHMGLSQPQTLLEFMQKEEQRKLNLAPEIRRLLANIKSATTTVLAYMEYAQNDLATGIDASEAELIKAKLTVLRATSIRVYENCNNLLALVQQSLGKLEPEEAREALSVKIYRNHCMILKTLFEEFNSKFNRV